MDEDSDIVCLRRFNRNETQNHRRKNSHLPFQVEFNYNFKESRHFNSINHGVKMEKFLAKSTIGNLKCKVSDVHEPEDGSYIYDLQFCPNQGYEHFLAIANEDGELIIQDTSDTKDPLKYQLETHNNAIFDVAWNPIEFGKLVTASGDQTVKLWDIAGERPRHVRDFKDFSQSVKCVEFVPNNGHLMATGSRDGSILLWDIRDSCEKKAALSIKRAHTHSVGNDKIKPSSVTAIQIQDESTLVSSSDSDGLLKIWDLRGKSYDRFKNDPIAKFTIPSPGRKGFNYGYTSLALTSSKSHLYACSKDNHIYCFDLASYNEKPLRSFTGFENGNKYFIKMSLSFDDKYLACGSSDKACACADQDCGCTQEHYAYVWSTSPYAPRHPIYKLNSHEKGVTCTEWSKNDWVLATCSGMTLLNDIYVSCTFNFNFFSYLDDKRHRIWRVYGDEELSSSREEVAGSAEKCEVQFNSKFTITDFFNIDKENEQLPQSKKRRQRSPLRNLPTTPRKNITFDSFPNAKSMMSPKKSLASPKKLTFSPRKLFSPTLNLPNLVRDGKSPHCPRSGGSSTKKTSRSIRDYFNKTPKTPISCANLKISDESTNSASKKRKRNLFLNFNQ